MHLPGIRIAEATDLEVDDDQASQTSMEKHQIDPEPRVVDSQAALPPDEREVVAEFGVLVLSMPNLAISGLGSLRSKALSLFEYRAIASYAIH